MGTHPKQKSDQIHEYLRRASRRSGAGKPDRAELAMRKRLESSFEVMARLFQEKAGLFARKVPMAPPHLAR